MMKIEINDRLLNQPITEEFLVRNGIVREEDSYILDLNPAYTDMFMEIQPEYIINIYKALDGLWDVHVDDGDRDTVGRITVGNVYDFMDFLRICGVNKEFDV